MSSRSSSVIEQYARALIEVLESRSERERSRVESDLEAAAGVVRQSADLQRFLSNPVIDGKRKLRVLSKTFPDAQPLSRRYIEVLVTRDRADLLAEIWDSYVRLRDERGQILVAELTSATPLGRDVARKYEHALEDATGRKVRVEIKEDPSLLGGMRTRIGSRVYDSSVRARLGMMRRSLLSE
ncbi:MAG: ATP synthase F1 subunit delta [Acidobacteria bacterium]|nr:ATP synthase F1 subunit delta [Acidobacteriota bacterium]